jgi:hypothetical protein
MKKLTLIAIIVCLVIPMGIFGADTDSKIIKANQKKIESFMKDYYHAYNNLAQEFETIDMMDEYWAPEFQIKIYFPFPEYPVLDLQTWKMFLAQGHISIKETLVPTETVIDTKTMKVTTKMDVKHNDRNGNELLIHLDALVIYDLKVDAGNNIKITKMQFFCSNPNAMMELYNMIPPQ